MKIKRFLKSAYKWSGPSGLCLSSLSVAWSGSEYTPGQGSIPDHLIQGTTFKNPQLSNQQLQSPIYIFFKFCPNLFFK